MANTFVFTAVPFDAADAKQLAQPDPQPHLAALAAKCPVHRGPDGTRTLMRHADIAAVARNPAVLGPGAHGATMGGPRPLIPLDLDGDEHRKFRRLLDPLFSARNMAALEAQVRALANSLLDSFADDGQADLQQAFCEPLPSILFLRLMGLPAQDLGSFLSMKDALLGHLPPTLTLPERMAASRDARVRCYEYLGRAIDERTAGGSGTGLLGELIAAEVDGERLSREQLLDISFLLILAGLDTVAASLACMIARLARDPALRRRLVATPSEWPSAVEELLRFEAPVPRGFRTTTVDLDVGGEVIPAQTTFFLSWAAGGLDEDVFAGALTLDPARQPNPHQAFGAGVHRCLGIHLARLELRVALEELHRRIPDYALQAGHALAFSGMPRKPNGLPATWK